MCSLLEHPYTYRSHLHPAASLCLFFLIFPLAPDGSPSPSPIPRRSTHPSTHPTTHPPNTSSSSSTNQYLLLQLDSTQQTKTDCGLRTTNCGFHWTESRTPKPVIPVQTGLNMSYVCMVICCRYILLYIVNICVVRLGLAGWLMSCLRGLLVGGWLRGANGRERSEKWCE